MKSTVVSILAALALLAPSGDAEGPAAERRSIEVPGLSRPVEIIRDRWGISHIYAENETDLFFAQGYSAACDRLFQFEMWRRQATGTVAEILGRRELKRDIGARLHGFRGDLTRELNHYHPRGEAIISAYVRGINARIGETERNPSILPIEFKMLGITPGRWTPEVVISRHQGLAGNVTQEIRNGRAVALLGAEKVRELSWFRPGTPVLEIDSAVDGSLLSDAVLDLYNAFRNQLRFTSDDVLPAYRAAAGASPRPDDPPLSELELMLGGDAIGSNNWVVGGSLSLTGFPIMANDPHRALQVPSLRYWVHLSAPGWNVIGGGEPVLPGVSIGHNEHGAWGLTIFGQDTEDLYVYETNPANPLQYRYQGGWEDMKVVTEKIPVKGEGEVSVDLKFTRHGPVLHEDGRAHKAYALRAAWLDYGAAPYLASLRMNQAGTWEEFRDACSYSRIPAENMVWADTKKNIGYQAVAVSPIRPNWSGLVPVPGDGRYEWDGYLPIRELPNELNPGRGYIRSANNYMIPDGYPHLQAIHFSWGDEMRAVRIDEVLRAGRMNTVVDMIKLQHDELSVPARNLVPFLRGLPLGEAEGKARELLLNWNFVMDAHSIPAAIYAAWERRLQANLRELLVPEAGRGLISINLKRMIDWVVAPDGRFGADPLAGRDALLGRSLGEAVSELTKKLGPDMGKWRYGQEGYKHVRLRHPLSGFVRPDVRARLDMGPLPRGGYGSTVNNTGSGDNQSSGASFRIIADTANWDNSVGTSAPGQSGDPDSPHYRDLFAQWAEGRYFPLFFSRGKVESVAGEILSMQPVAEDSAGGRPYGKGRFAGRERQR